MAKKMPAHIASAEGKTYPDWMTNVIQRKAPGAINAIALTVTPVRPSVGFIFGASEAAVIGSPSTLHKAELLTLPRDWQSNPGLGSKQDATSEMPKTLRDAAITCLHFRHLRIRWSSDRLVFNQPF